MSKLADFLARREDWLRVVIAPNAHGNYDIALVIDGGYGVEDAVRNAEDYKRQLAEAFAADGLPLGPSARPQIAGGAIEDVA